jgi:hypothetical protein
MYIYNYNNIYYALGRDPHVSNFDWTVVWQVVRRDGDQVGPGRGNTGDA